MKKKNILNYIILAAGITLGISYYPSIKDSITDIRQKIAFNYHNLKEVDMSKKDVDVQVYIEKDCSVNKEETFKFVKQFYNKMDINLNITYVNSVDTRALSHNNIAVKILPLEKWKKRAALSNSKSLFETIVKYTITTEKNGIADLSKRRCYLPCQGKADIYYKTLATLNKTPELKSRLWASTIVHEIGHLFMLYHTNEFTDDPIEDFTQDKINFMKKDAFADTKNISEEYSLGLSFNEFQKKMVHSYLSKGLVYKQFELVDKDAYEYLRLIKETNNFH